MGSTPESAPAPVVARDSDRLGRRAIRGFLSMALGTGARAVLKVALLAVLGRLLTPADFGRVEAAGIIVWLSMIFAGLGVSAAIIQRDVLEPRHVMTAGTASIVLGAVIGAVVVALAPWFEQLLRVEGLAPMVRGLALVFPVAGASAVAESLLQRELRFGVIARGEIISYAVGYGAAGVPLALAGFGAWALVFAEITKTIVKAALFLHATPASRHVGFDATTFRELVRFGSGYTASGLTTYVASQGDNAVVARVLGTAALGYYGRAFELMVVPAQGLGMLLDKVLFPTMSVVQGKAELLRLAYQRGTALVALTVIPVAAMTVVLAPEVMTGVLGPGWEPAVLPLRILAIGMYFRVAYMVGHAVANSTGAVHQAAWRNATYAALIVAGALVGARWGLGGVAGGVLLAVSVNFVMVFGLAARITSMTATNFLALHVPALRLAALIGAESWTAAALLRRAGAGPILVLVVCGGLAAVTTLAVLRFAARALGPEGEWIARTLHDRAPQPIQVVIRYVMPRQS